MILVALAMVAIIAMAAMSIDLVTLYLAREEAQRAADAAALAAARVISASGITGAGDPSGSNVANWLAVCGSASGWATQAAAAAAAQNSVGGLSATTVSVTYSDGSGGPGTNDCSTLSATFTVNPMVTVQVQQTSLPSFFSRIWGIAGSNISASATAEAFNPSASDANGVAPSGSVTPVQPRCVKPWIVPNLDPVNPAAPHFVTLLDGTISTPGINPTGASKGAVIGETFNLVAACANPGSPCSVAGNNPPAANVGPGQPNLQYLPGAVPATVAATPSCAIGGTSYELAVAGCDQTTQYQCGLQSSSVANPNMIDLSENPGGIAGDTATGLACSLTGAASLPMSGQDQLRTTSYPFVALAGSANPVGIGAGTPVTSSNSIVSLPIYDGAAVNPIGTTNINIVGFLQVFVNLVNPDGSVNVTVLNVAGCGNAATNSPVYGSSPVPIRLITPH